MQHRCPQIYANLQRISGALEAINYNVLQGVW